MSYEFMVINGKYRYSDIFLCASCDTEMGYLEKMPILAKKQIDEIKKYDLLQSNAFALKKEKDGGLFGL